MENAKKRKNERPNRQLFRKSSNKHHGLNHNIAVIFMVSEYSLKNTARTRFLMMSLKDKKPAAILTIAVILLGFALTNTNIASSSSIGGKLDMYTQKEPYSGKGPNSPSDAFSPHEVVVLYALVTYNDIPVSDLLVAFYFALPNNNSFSLTSPTNSSGIAKVNFTILMPPINVTEDDVFGQWTALANTFFEEQVFQDTLAFEVDWIVKLISVRTIDENLTYRTNFGLGGDVGLEVSLRSVAMALTNATITAAIFDELDIPVSSHEIRDFRVQPNGKLIFLYFKLCIPQWAFVGNATVFMSAFTAPASEGGVPYCPGLSTSFLIVPHEQLTIVFRDMAVVDVVPSSTSVELHQPLNIIVTIRNEGTEVENCSVDACFGVMFLGSLEAEGLSPYSEVTLSFAVNTSQFGVGNYGITVSIPSLSKEADLTDNLFIDGVVEIKPETPIIVHDIKIIGAKISKNSLYIGELLQINVSVVNKGTETETFNVSTFFDSSPIKTMIVESLTPHTEATLIFFWNTSLLSEGYYQISASAPLTDDINPADNTYIDGVVQLKSPAGLLIHDVAVLDMTPSSTSAYIGDIIDITVVVKNLGNYTESFNITLSHDTGTIGRLAAENLEPNMERTLVFQWNTANMSEGNYLLTATASSVPDETNLENNSFVDGSIELTPAPTGWFIPDWFYWLFALLLMLILILLLFLLYRRRRKRTENSLNSGWTAWYYCYDMRNRTFSTNKKQTKISAP
jgi:hypothetical protein